MTGIVKLIVLFLAFSTFQSCKKDGDIVASATKDDTAFLNTKQFFFRATLPDSSVVWRYGLYEFQRGAGSMPLGIGERQQKSLSFDLVSNRDLSTRISIATPSFDVQTNELFSKILVEGKKEIGGSYNKFELALTLNKTVYTTRGDQTNSSLKVLKTETSKDEFNRDVVLVWFKVNCTLYSTVDSSVLTLKDGYILAAFMYNL